MNNNADFEFKEIACPVCESPDSSVVGYRGGEAHHSGAGVKTTIVRCKGCSHQFPNPMPYPTRGLEDIYVDAAEYFRGHDVEKKKQRGLELMSEFERRLGRKGKFLDVGCGVGELLWAANKAGWDADGLDPSPEFVKLAGEHLGVTARVATLEEANYPDESFDAIALGGIIEHLYDPVGTLREIGRVLKTSGWLWFDAPNEDGLYMHFGNLYQRMLGRDWVIVLAPTFPPFHVQGFNPKSIGKILDRTSFKMEEISMFGEISPQTGASTLLKKVEYNVGRAVNGLDKLLGKGMYMNIWARKVGR